ncbi:MAG: ATP-binding protein [Cetobacterium sp.]
MKKKIRPSSNIIDSIGKNLIIDEISAIIELIKNSYDADAENVIIKLKNDNENNLIITIEDDGHGMSFETVENNWMVPATSYKINNKYSPLKNRRVLGEKGLGRYSVAILGNFLRLETVKNLQKTTLELDWDSIKKFKYLDEVEFDINVQKTSEKNGTKLIIKKKNYLTWSIKKKIELEKELRKLLSPVSISNDIFRVYLIFEDFKIYNPDNNDERIITETKEVLSYDLFEYYDYKLIAKIDKKMEINYSIYLNNNELLKEDKIEQKEVNRILNKESASFPGPFNLEFRVFNRDVSGIASMQEQLKKENDKIGKLEVRQLLNELSGVSIYKNRFRIRPYGEERYDWLELNKRRFLNPTFRISNNQINGMVTLSDEISLVEKSARDGLQEDNNFNGLKAIVLEILSRLEIEKAQNKKQNEKHKPYNEKELFEKIGNFQNVKRKIKELTFNLPEDQQKKIEEIITEKEKEDLKEVNEIKDLIVKYEKHVTLGKIVNRVMHEGRKPISFFKNGCNFLRRETRKFLRNPSEEAIEKIMQKTTEFDEQTEKISRLFKSIEPLSSQKRQRAKETNLKEIIMKSLFVYDADLKNIILEINTEDVYSIVVDSEIQTAITNILENSLYWINESERQKKLIINLFKTENNKAKIEIIDSGPGIAEEDIKLESIFEPGFTRKSDGTGLGLSIAGESLKRNGFELKVKSYSTGAYLIMEEK